LYDQPKEQDTAMTYSARLCLLLTTLLPAKANSSDEEGQSGDATPAPFLHHLREGVQQLLDLAAQFRGQAVDPAATLQFEQQVQLRLRELGRLVVQHTYNALESDDVQVLPKHVRFLDILYTRLARKTKQHVWTLFGQIRLYRIGYRSTCKGGEPTLFPLGHCLGLCQGVSPALASHAGRLFAAAGMTQRATLQRLRADCGVSWGVKKLRQFLKALQDRLDPVRHDCQVRRLLELLGQAQASKGQHRPVLAVGRDGISLGIRAKKKCIFEIATTATVSVYDRCGQRLGTVYLAYAPQPEQVRMSQELTRLLRGVLLAWKEPLPRLCYISDAGQSETGYYQQVLRGMRHPVTQQRLKWVRVLDYYHASQRIWKMAECLFGQGRQAESWAKKMLKLLLLPGGANRVLHSAAAQQWRLSLAGKKKEEFSKAYKYLSKRMRYMRYADYRRQGMPLGSGVTEAGCKTVYTHRLKLSGMRWKDAGVPSFEASAQTVLDLRVLLLSELWETALLASLRTIEVVRVLTNQPTSTNNSANAA
jgi:hypothetical protein